MACMTGLDATQLVLKIIEERSPKPTELLEALATELSYTEIQDAVSELLERGTVQLGSDRRLRVATSAAAD